MRLFIFLILAGIFIIIPAFISATPITGAGSCLSLNGTQNASAIDNATLDLGTQGKSFTIEAWVFVDPADVNPISAQIRRIFFKNQAYRFEVDFKRTSSGSDNPYFDIFNQT